MTTHRNEDRSIQTQLAVIGTGLAGTAAAVFAYNRNIPCTIAGGTGALAYTTGYFDLLGYLNEKFLDNPWHGLTQLAKSNIRHPLAAVDADAIRNGFEEYLAFIGKSGIGYSTPGEKNVFAITPAGTLKPTLCLPKTMEQGVAALTTKAPCTIIGFNGLKGFSSRQICANLNNRWNDLKAKLIDFPGHTQGELYAEVAARSLEVSSNREILAAAIREAASGSTYVGLPAVLGMHAPDEVLDDLERQSGLKLFEIPTMPPSVPGIRLREMFEQQLPASGIHLIPQQKIRKIEFSSDMVDLQLADNHGPIRIEAQSVLLASGRFLSGGLQAHYDHVSESLIGLPVSQPPSREDWYQQDYLDSKGHEIHMAGIETDEAMRPLAENGRVYDTRLFAAGIILAHQDWIRQRCGAGIAIATAYKAVDAISDFLGT